LTSNGEAQAGFQSIEKTPTQGSKTLITAFWKQAELSF
jgi:hypothetical protein